eukprot:g2407.t1
MQKELESLQKEVHRLSSRHQEALESNSKFQARLEQQKECLLFLIRQDAWETFLANHGRQRRQEELRMKDLRSELGEAKKGVGDGKVVQERKQLESDERQATFVERLELLKADIQNVMDSLGLTEGAANLVETVNSLMQSSGEHAAGLQELRQRSDAHMAHLETLQSRADGAVKEAELLKQKDQEIEEIFLEKIEDLRNSMGLNEARPRGVSQGGGCQDQGGCRVLGKAGAPRRGPGLRAQGFHERRQVIEGRCGRRCQPVAACGQTPESCSQTLRALEQKISGTQEQVSSLCGTAQKKFLLRQEYWKGLTRGIQETHRKVALTERLPLKSPRPADGSQPPRGSLPALTKTVGATP